MSGFKLGGLKKTTNLNEQENEPIFWGAPAVSVKVSPVPTSDWQPRQQMRPHTLSHRTFHTPLLLLFCTSCSYTTLPYAECSNCDQKKKRNFPRPVTGIENETQQPLSRLIILSLFLAHNKAQYLVMVGCFGSDMRSAIFHLGCDYTRHFSLRGELMTMPPGSTLFFLSLSLSLQQEVVSAPFTHQSVRRAHGLRSAAHSTLFTQPPTALSPQVSPSACIWCISVCCTIAKQVLFLYQVSHWGGSRLAVFMLI